MDLNHRSTGYEPVGITWLPHPASHHKCEDRIYVFTGFFCDSIQLDEKIESDFGNSLGVLTVKKVL